MTNGLELGRILVWITCCPKRIYGVTFLLRCCNESVLYGRVEHWSLWLFFTISYETEIQFFSFSWNSELQYLNICKVYFSHICLIGFSLSNLVPCLENRSHFMSNLYSNIEYSKGSQTFKQHYKYTENFIREMHINF